MPNEFAPTRDRQRRIAERRGRPLTTDPTERRTSAELKALILDSARSCFVKWGVQRTKMGDIARELGIARPNLYRFYESKQALVLEVMLVEHRSLNEERRRSIKLDGPVDQVIIESVLVGWRRMFEDAEMRVLNDPENFALSSVLRASEEMKEVRREYWFDVFDYGRARGELRDDLDNEEVMFWLTVVQALFLEDAATFPDEATVRNAVERYVLPSVLKPAAQKAAATQRARARRP